MKGDANLDVNIEINDEQKNKKICRSHYNLIPVERSSLLEALQHEVEDNKTAELENYNNNFCGHANIIKQGFDDRNLYVLQISTRREVETEEMFKNQAWKTDRSYVKYSNEQIYQYILPAFCMLNYSNEKILIWVQSRARKMGVGTAFLEKFPKYHELEIKRCLDMSVKFWNLKIGCEAVSFRDLCEATRLLENEDNYCKKLVVTKTVGTSKKVLGKMKKRGLVIDNSQSQLPRTAVIN